MTTFKRGDIVIVQHLTGVKGRQEIWEASPAKIMVIADGYAMVRHKGAAPFVVSLRDLEKWNTPHDNIA